ncbi:MAG TPA: peptidoglycan-associated lipoprotein Pal [Geobacteraceae bacterium]|jgi:peptidoglycan-associated lipoprotein|nr:peptidoglycan-associated lipoprotein Pal [Geobacteraceae bacterium]
MRKGMVGFFVVLCCGALLSAGCAKKEMVKGEEPISPPAAKPTETAPPKPAAKEEAVKAEPVKEMPIAKEEVKEQVQAVAEENLKRIQFDFDSYVLSASARDTLSGNADYLLKKNLAVKVQIEGHCDERGSDEYNLALGEKRAKVALNYLVSLGVPAERLSFISYGKEKPLDPGHDEAAWAKNRRDEFIVIK